MQLVDREQAEHVDAALETMKQSLQVLREPSQVGSYSLWNIYVVLLLIGDFFVCLFKFKSKFSENPHRTLTGRIIFIVEHLCCFAFDENGVIKEM